MELTKQALRVENNQSFPNNNNGQITPTNLRTFNENMIDSLVDEIAYTADSASFDSRINNITGSATNTGSLLVTASAVSNVLTFTKGDSSTFNVTVGSDVNITSLNQFTASQLVINGEYNTFTQSADSRLDNLELQTGSYASTSSFNAYTASNNQRVTSLEAFTSSQQVLNGTFATTGSNQFNGSQSISGSVTLSGSLINVDHIDFNTASLTPAWKSGRVFWDNTDSCVAVYNAEADITLQVGQEQWVKVRNNTGVAITNGAVVRLVGAQGDNPLVVLAQSLQVSGSLIDENQVLGVATHTIETGTDGYVTTLGNVRGLNTNAFNEGDILWISSSAGQLTNVIPVAPYERTPVAVVIKKGPGGSGIIYVAPQQPIDFSNLSSVAITGNYTDKDMWQYEGNVWKHKSIAQIGLATTGSNLFTGTQTFNNIVVNGTASIAYLQTVTGSAKIIGDAFIILNNNTPTERYAGLKVYDSGSANTTASFQFDGLTNDWFFEKEISSSAEFGVALFGPEYTTLGSPTYLTTNRIPKAANNHHLNDTNISDDGSNVSINSNTQITGSLLINGNAPLIYSDLTSLNNFTTSIQAEVDNLQSVTGSYATTGSNTFVGNQVISGSTTITGDLNITPVVVPDTPPGAFQKFVIPMLSGSTNTLSRDAGSSLYFIPLPNTLAVSSSVGISNMQPTGLSSINTTNGRSDVTPTTVSNTPIIGKYIAISGDPSLFNGSSLFATNPGIILQSGSAVTAYYTPIEFQSSQSFTDGRVTITRPLIGLEGAEITGSVRISGNLTASLQEGYVWVGDLNGRTTTVPTSSFGGGGAAFPFTGSAEITGSLGITGSLSGFVNTLTITSQTASLDFNTGNFFTLQLVSGSITHLTATNIRPGQTINLLVKTDIGIPSASGSLTFSPTFKFAGGFDYTPTAITGSQDLVSFVTFDTTQIFAAQVKNLS